MNTTVGPHQVWRRHDDLAEVVSEGRAAILRLGDLELPPLILEGSAAAIWGLVAEQTTRDELVESVSATFEVSTEEVAPAVDQFLIDLVEAGLLVREASASLTVSALGTHITLEVSGAEGALLHERLVEAWSGCLVSTTLDPPAAEVVLPVSLDRADELLATMEWITQEVTRQSLEGRKGEALMLHACAVASTTGEAVVFVGPSGMGKTTLASHLGTRWGYVTDETAAVAVDGGLAPYPKPLSVIEAADEAKRQVSPVSLGLLPVPAQLRVAAVVLLDRRRDPGDAETGLDVELLPNVDGVALLAEHTSYLSSLEHPMQRIGELLRSTGGLRRVRYTATQDLEPLVATLIGAPATEQR